MLKKVEASATTQQRSLLLECNICFLFTVESSFNHMQCCLGGCGIVMCTACAAVLTECPICENPFTAFAFSDACIEEV